jgi:hypothetical protein
MGSSGSKQSADRVSPLKINSVYGSSKKQSHHSSKHSRKRSIQKSPIQVKFYPLTRKGTKKGKKVVHFSNGFFYNAKGNPSKQLSKNPSRHSPNYSRFDGPVTGKLKLKINTVGTFPYSRVKISPKKPLYGKRRIEKPRSRSPIINELNLIGYKPSVRPSPKVQRSLSKYMNEHYPHHKTTGPYNVNINWIGMKNTPTQRSVSPARNLDKEFKAVLKLIPNNAQANTNRKKKNKLNKLFGPMKRIEKWTQFKALSPFANE